MHVLICAVRYIPAASTNLCYKIDIDLVREGGKGEIFVKMNGEVGTLQLQRTSPFFVFSCMDVLFTLMLIVPSL